MSEAVTGSTSPGMQFTSADPQAAARAALYQPPRISLLVPTIAAASGSVLYIAWKAKEEMYLHAGRDVGYALGIVGLGMMVLLLGYPLRKRMRALHSFGALPLWFQIHMVLGVLGPVAILLHCNFQLGSINSTIALLSTLLVATSGFIGRFAYTRIHYGLFGRREHFSELKEQMDGLRERIRSQAPRLAEELKQFGDWVAPPRPGVSTSAARFFGVGRRVRRLRRLTRNTRGPQAALLRSAIDSYLRAGHRVAQIGVYERIFSLWHAFHLPVAFFLYSAAIVHVVAVHLY